MELQFLNSMQIVHSISSILLWDIPRDRRKRVEGYNINLSFSRSPEFAGQDGRRKQSVCRSAKIMYPSSMPTEKTLIIMHIKILPVAFPNFFSAIMFRLIKH